MRVTLLGFCLRVIVKENLEKTTSSVLSVILLNLWLKKIKMIVKKISSVYLAELDLFEV